MIKKNLLLALLMLSSLFANAAILEYGGLKFYISYDFRTAEVIGYSTTPSDAFVIPETVPISNTECPVKAIANGTFSGCTEITSVVIPNSVETIGHGAFEGCIGIESISIGYGVKYIEDYAFHNCTSLTAVHITDLEAWCNIQFGNEVSTDDYSNPIYYARHLFLNEEEIVDLVIPEGIDTIKARTFVRCNGLQSVTFHEGVKSIGIASFRECNGLTSLQIPSTVKEICAYAFLYCGNLSSVKMNDSIERIGLQAFYGSPASIEMHISDLAAWCSRNRSKNDILGMQLFLDGEEIKDLVIPEGVDTIGTYAFNGYSALTSVSIPGSVKTIEFDAFANCSNLETVTFAEGLEHLRQGAFYGCPSLGKVVLPNTLKSIGEGVFRDCASLTTVTLGESTDSIAKWVFDGTGLTDLYCYAQTLPETHSDIFVNGDGISNGDGSALDLSGATLHVREDVLAEYSSTAPWSEFGNIVAIAKYAENVEIGNLTYNINTDSMTAEVSGYVTEPTGELVIPESVMYEGAVCKVTAICDSAFANCINISSVSIPSTIVKMYNNAFNECTGLTAVHISDMAAWCNIDIDNSSSHPLYYAKRLFLNGEEVKDLVIPEGVTTIRGGIFHSCTSLQSLSIPESVTTICEYAFKGCTGLTTLSIPESVTTIKEYAFAECSGLQSLTLPNSITSIERYVFSDCSGLQSLTIPESVTTIEGGAFIRCSGLQSLTIPECVTTIGTYAFYGCNGLQSLTIPESITTIEAQTFQDCDGLTSLSIPGSVKTIGLDAFAYCDKLGTVTFSEGLEHLEQGAFYQCPLLKEVVLPNTLKSIGEGVFRDCASLTTVTLGESTDSIAKWVFGGTGLTDLYCYAQTLPETHSDIFVNGDGISRGDGSALDLTSATLHVPEEALAEYSSTAPWSSFGNIVAMEKPKATVKIGSTGATTFCSEYDLDFSDVTDIKAYVATGYNSETGAITMMRVTNVKAGTGLYIKGPTGEYDIPVVRNVSFNSLNMLVGVTEATDVAPVTGEYTNYIYTTPTGKSAAFYKLSFERTIPAGKSYLQIPTLWLPITSESKMKLEFDDWATTDIKDMEEYEDVNNKTIYDLQGRPVASPAKGSIYIVNGKKVLYR